MSSNFPEISVESLNRQKKIWGEDDEYEKYRWQDSALEYLFMGSERAKRNTDMDVVLLKVSALNDFYSTNIYDTYSIAKVIFDKGEYIDNCLDRGDTEIVDYILSSNKFTRRPYSFITKYCSRHCPSRFPIYDSIVRDFLWECNKKRNFLQTDVFKNYKEDIRTYENFLKVIDSFKKAYELEEFDSKEIDRLLWMLGRDYLHNGHKEIGDYKIKLKRSGRVEISYGGNVIIEDADVKDALLKIASEIGYKVDESQATEKWAKEIIKKAKGEKRYANSKGN